MAKLDKSQYTKEQWRKIKEARRQEKAAAKLQQQQTVTPSVKEIHESFQPNTAFVLGNGVSRAPIDPEDLKKLGKVYGCNALYRTFEADYLVAVDVKMILEINKSRYQHKVPVWTNPNKSFQNMSGLNYFSPSKGWSSGPTALWLASQHGFKNVYILCFDFQGIDNAKFNNLYADTMNYKKSTEGPTFYGNWMRQTRSVFKDHTDINYYRIVNDKSYLPKDLNDQPNFKNLHIDTFKEQFSL